MPAAPITEAPKAEFDANSALISDAEINLQPGHLASASFFDADINTQPDQPENASFSDANSASEFAAARH